MTATATRLSINLRQKNSAFVTLTLSIIYRNFDLQAANLELCAAQCAQDGRCRAWTYVKPGAQGPNARCGVVHVTALDDGGCAPLKGTPGPGTFQRFRYTWQFSENVSTLRLGQTVRANFTLVGDQQKCLDQNPFMLMLTNDEHARNRDGERFYFDPSRVSPGFHSGALRGLTMSTTLSGRQQNQKVIHIYVTGFNGYRGMQLNFEYVYTFQKSQ